MADVVEDSSTIANEQKDPDINNTSPSKVEPSTKEAAVVKTNGEDHKDEPSDEKSERKNEESEKASERKDYDRSSRDHKDRGKYSEPWKHDRYNNRGRHNDRGRHDGRGRGGRGRGNYKSESQRKSKYDHLEESSDAIEIRNQVEFYFTDSNLPTDKFLLEKTGGHNNYPVDLKVIHSFARMRRFQPYSAVRDAVAASQFLNLNDKDQITRVTPLDEKFTDDLVANRKLVHGDSMPRSIYAKGFGEEREDSQIDIEQFFQPYGEIRSCRLRREQDTQAFKGSVFVEFKDEETAQAFLAVDPKPQYNGKELEIMSKQGYVDKKASAIRDGTVRPRSPTRGDFGFRGRGGRGRGGGHRDSRDWKGRDDRRGGGKGKFGKRGGRGGRDDGRLKRERSEDRSDYSDDDRDGKRRRRSYSDDRSERSESRSGRSASPDGRKRKRSLDDRGDDDVPTRAEAEAKKAKLESDAAVNDGAVKEDTSGGAEVKAEGNEEVKEEAKA